MIAGYEIADFLAWDAPTWDRLLSSYHGDIWPAHIVAMVLFAFALRYCITSVNRYRRAPVMLVLAGCWAWVALSFHAHYHAQLNWAAHYWVVACLIQSVLLLALAMVPNKPGDNNFVWRPWLWLLLIALCLAVLTGIAWGRPVSALAWPLLSPAVLAWVTMVTGNVWAALARRPWLVGLMFIVPALVLVVDGLVAYSLPAPDRLIVVVAALISTLLAPLVSRASGSLR